LATDQDLNKDGVQAIDDEFLEWFVKNPSCENIETEFFAKFSNNLYKIIIPNEDKNIQNTFITGKIEFTLVNSKGRRLELKDFARAFANNSKVTYYDDERCLNQTCRIVSLSEDSLTIASKDYQYNDLSFDKIININWQEEPKKEFPTVNGSYGCVIPIKEAEKEDWQFERSSGFKGYRNKITNDWIYESKFNKLFSEPKQEEAKQETLEEVMNKDGYHESDYDKIWREGVQFGAKWQQENTNINALNFEIDALKKEIKVLKHQQEQDKNKFSEEDLREAFIEGYKQRAEKSDLIFDNASRMYAIALFEQYKNK
jgi:hypothetical protein